MINNGNLPYYSLCDKKLKSKGTRKNSVSKRSKKLVLRKNSDFFSDFSIARARNVIFGIKSRKTAKWNRIVPPVSTSCFERICISLFCVNEKYNVKYV